MCLNAKADVNHQAFPPTQAMQEVVSQHIRPSVRCSHSSLTDFSRESNSIASFNGGTALMWAIRSSKVTEACALVAARADLSIRDGMGRTALEAARHLFGGD